MKNKEENLIEDMTKFINGLEDNELSEEDKEFNKYCELYEERFGKHAYIAEPSGTKEQTINAIKICLEENLDIFEDLLFKDDILNERWFLVKKIENYEELEKYLIKSVIYYILATRDEILFNIDSVFRILSYDRKFLEHYINELPIEHLSKQNYQKVSFLNDVEYKYVVNAIKEKIAEVMSIYYNQELYYFGKMFESEKDVDKYVEQILEDKSGNMIL